MSDHGDYRQPKAGDWGLISNHTGVVAILRVERIHPTQYGMVAICDDNSAWGVETGAPLDRKWKGHTFWTADLCDIIDETHREMDRELPLDVRAKVLAMLLAAKVEKK